ncbi:MAG: hypothetical protein Kow00104_05150 [Rhodothalassiaceae bacterium]
MSSLSALPDHEVARILMPQALGRHLSRADALAAIAADPGFVPIAVDPRDGRVFWANIGDHPLKEWQFTYTMQYLSETDKIRDAFTSDFEVLEDAGSAVGGLEPSAFIFHISRCGSTLLAKALARLDSNIVINQGSALQRGFWAALTDDFRRPLAPTPEALAAFRHILLAMARRRRESNRTAIVKFVSWNTLYIDFIRKAFPEVPCLFLYRDPVEVIASVIQRPTPALVAKGGRLASVLLGEFADAGKDMSDIAYLAACTANYFRAALAAADDGLGLLNYRDIRPENFAEILDRGLGIRPEAGELETMREQFRFHSKDDGDARPFQSDSLEKSRMISQEDKAAISRISHSLFTKLDRSAHNLFAGTD